MRRIIFRYLGPIFGPFGLGPQGSLWAVLQLLYKIYIRSLQTRRILRVIKSSGEGEKEGLPMFVRILPKIRWFLSLAFFLNLTVQNAISAPEGVVNVALEWGSSSRTTYTYVFSGLVTCQNRPCSNARVDLNLESTSDGAITQSTRAGDDGRYQMEVTVQGTPEASSAWKLEAHSSSVQNQESAEAEGRVILMEGQTTVVVDRSLLLIQA